MANADTSSYFINQSNQVQGIILRRLTCIVDEVNSIEVLRKKINKHRYSQGDINELLTGAVNETYSELVQCLLEYHGNPNCVGWSFYQTTEGIKQSTLLADAIQAYIHTHPKRLQKQEALKFKKLLLKKGLITETSETLATFKKREQLKIINLLLRNGANTAFLGSTPYYHLESTDLVLNVKKQLINNFMLAQLMKIVSNVYKDNKVFSEREKNEVAAVKILLSPDSNWFIYRIYKGVFSTSSHSKKSFAELPREIQQKIGVYVIENELCKNPYFLHVLPMNTRRASLLAPILCKLLKVLPAIKQEIESCPKEDVLPKAEKYATDEVVRLFGHANLPSWVRPGV